MNTNIKPGKEIVVSLHDKVGLLSDITTAVAEARVNIRAVCAYVTDGSAHLRLITDNNERAIKALHNAGFKVTEHDVFLCEIAPHIMHPDIESLVSNYEVNSNYWCAATHSGEHAMLVFSPAEGFKGCVTEYA